MERIYKEKRIYIAEIKDGDVVSFFIDFSDDPEDNYPYFGKLNEAKTFSYYDEALKSLTLLKKIVPNSEFKMIREIHYFEGVSNSDFSY